MIVLCSCTGKNFLCDKIVKIRYRKSFHLKLSLLSQVYEFWCDFSQSKWTINDSKVHPWNGEICVVNTKLLKVLLLNLLGMCEEMGTVISTYQAWGQVDVIVLLYFYSIYSFDYLKIEHDTRVVFVCDNNCCVGFKNFFFWNHFQSSN